MFAIAFDANEIQSARSVIEASAIVHAFARACDAFACDEFLVVDSASWSANDDDEDGDARANAKDVARAFARARARTTFAYDIAEWVATPRALRNEIFERKQSLRDVGHGRGAANTRRDSRARGRTYVEGVVVVANVERSNERQGELGNKKRKKSNVVDFGDGERCVIDREVTVGRRVVARMREPNDASDERGDQDVACELPRATVVSANEAKAKCGSWPYVTRVVPRGGLKAELERFRFIVAVDHALASRDDDGSGRRTVMTDIAVRAKNENVLILFGEVGRLFRAEGVDVRSLEKAAGGGGFVAVDAFGRTVSHAVESQSKLRVDESVWIVLARLTLE